MFGIDLSSFVQVLFWLIVAVLIGVAVLIFMLGKAPAAPAGTWQAKAQAAIAAKDIHQADDVYKASPLFPAMQHLEQIVQQLAAKAKADATQLGNTIQADAAGLANKLRGAPFILNSVDGGATADPQIAALQQQINLRQQELARQAGTTAVPAANTGEGLESYAARIGVDPAAMRMLSALHPADTWEQLADRIKNPAKYFTDADRDTVAAAQGQVAVNR